MKEKINIKSLSLNQLIKEIEELGEKKFRAKQIYERIWAKGSTSFDDFTELSKKLRLQLEERFFINNLEIVNTQKSKDKTTKLAFKTSDNYIVEGVLIPGVGRSTGCISTQAGCALNCYFCATAKTGFNRDLTAEEISEQAYKLESLSEEVFDRRLSNIVLMGMGEPLLNYDNTFAAIEKIITERGMSPSRITLSTSGIVPGIRKMADNNIKINLSVSLHTANNEKRSKLMPINKKYPLNELSKAIVYFNQKTNIRVTLEYLIMKDINDSLEDAAELAEYCKSFPCKINIIEFNDINSKNYKRTPRQKLEEFAEYLSNKNMIVNIRRSKGQDIDAACGQLAGRQLKK